jgi:hypothetical protein
MNLNEEIARIKSILYEKNQLKIPKYLKDEMDELERASQDLSRQKNFEVSVEDLISAFQISEEEILSDDVWKKLENTESNKIKNGQMSKVIDLAKKYHKTNPLKLKKAIESGNYDSPLILKFGDRYHLVAGNTRLCTAAALGITPKVRIAKINK